MLPTEDADISRLVERGLKRQGIDVHTGTPVAGREHERDAGVSFSYGERVRREVDYLVIAAGRGADVEGARPRRGAASSWTSAAWSQVDGALRTTARGRVRDRRPRRRARRSRTRPPTRASSRPRTRAGLPTHPIAYVDIPRATFCTPNVGSFGLTEAQAREQGYDVVVGKVPYGAVGGGTVYGDRTGLVKVVGETQVRRAARRAHRRLARDRDDPGARQRARARGRLPRARAHHPRPPDAVGGRHGGRPRRRRLADPRLGEEPRHEEACSATAAFYFDLASPQAYLAAERILHVLPGPGRVAAGARARAPGRPRRGRGRPLREEARALRAEIARRAQRAGPAAAALARRRSRSTARWRCAWRPTPSRSAARCPFAQAAFRQAFAGGRSLAEQDYVLIAAAACEMHPAAVLRGAELRSVGAQLDAATARPPRGRRERACPRCVVERGSAGSSSLPAVVHTASARSRRPATVRMPARAPLTAPGAAMKADRAYRLIVTRGGLAPALLADAQPRRPHRDRRDRQRRGGAVLGPPAAGGLAPGARAARGPRRSWRPRSSSRAGYRGCS